MAADKSAAKKTKNTADGAEKRKYTFHFSKTGLVCSITVLVMGLVWVFIFGVLVGRGYQPEATVPELARIMPKAKAQSNATVAQPEPEHVLKAAELDFSKRLKAAVETPGTEKPGAEPTKSAGNGNKVSSVKSAKAAPAKPPRQKAKRVQPPTPGKDAFVYVYQCASFRKLSMAQELEQRIDAKGLNAGVESSVIKGRTWHRVLVYFTGTPEATGPMKQTLRTVGVKKPIMRSKKPI